MSPFPAHSMVKTSWSLCKKWIFASAWFLRRARDVSRFLMPKRKLFFPALLKAIYGSLTWKSDRRHHCRPWNCRRRDTAGSSNFCRTAVDHHRRVFRESRLAAFRKLGIRGCFSKGRSGSNASSAHPLVCSDALLSFDGVCDGNSGRAPWRPESRMLALVTDHRKILVMTHHELPTEGREFDFGCWHVSLVRCGVAWPGLYMHAHDPMKASERSGELLSRRTSL